MLYLFFTFVSIAHSSCNTNHAIFGHAFLHHMVFRRYSPSSGVTVVARAGLGGLGRRGAAVEPLVADDNETRCC